MNSNRQPKGIPTGGQFAASRKAEPKIYVGGSQAMQEVVGRLERSSDESISEQEARMLWFSAMGIVDGKEGKELSLAFRAGQNLAQNRATPAAVLHDMVVERDKNGRQETRAYFMEKLPMKDALQAVINNPNTSSETLFVIARGFGHQPQSDAASRRLKEMRRGASLSERLRLFGEWRKVGR